MFNPIVEVSLVFNFLHYTKAENEGREHYIHPKFCTVPETLPIVALTTV